MLRPGDRVALVACSDGLTKRDEPELARLHAALADIGLAVTESPLLFDDRDVAGRAAVLEAFGRDPGIAAVLDVSGGDLAGGVLTHLDLEAAARPPFFGYSDLTTLANALHARTGRTTHLWSPRNLVRSDGAAQVARFRASVLGDADDLFRLRTVMVRGEAMAGPMIGGNLRCLLKLAGTPHLPEPRGAVLALESLGAGARAVQAGLHQLRQMGVLDVVAGVLLGTFTALEREQGEDAAARIVLEVVPPHVPVAVTRDFGHGPDSRALRLGAHWDSRTH